MDTCVFFHVTLMDNVESIRKQGLIPQIGQLSEDFGETEPAIYLFPSKEEMDNALFNWLGEWYEEYEERLGKACELAILEVRLPSDFPVFSEEVDWEYTTQTPIPPSCITFYDEIGNKLPEIDRPLDQIIQAAQTRSQSHISNTPEQTTPLVLNERD